MSPALLRLVWLGSALFGVLFGVAYLARPVTAVRTIVKTLAVALLAVAAYFAGAPPLLSLGLALSAMGDAFLAGDPKRWLPAGMIAFLVAHLAYINFFNEIGGAAQYLAEPWRILPALAVTGGAVYLMRWLWPHIGPLRYAVGIYAAAIVLMVLAAFTLDLSYWPAILGAAAFMGSDAILSVRLFKNPDQWGSLGGNAVWWLYYGGQALIAYAFLRPF
jgi:uncharacterized membrane protein YhhN